MKRIVLLISWLFVVTASHAQSRRGAVQVPLFKPTQIVKLEGGNLNKNQAVLIESATSDVQREAIVRINTRFVDHRGQWRGLHLQFFRYEPQPNAWIMRADVEKAEFTELSLFNKTQTDDNLDGNTEMNTIFSGFYPMGGNQVVLFFNNKAQLAGMMDVNGDILHQGMASLQIVYQDLIEGNSVEEGSFLLQLGELNRMGNTLSQFKGFSQPVFVQNGYPERI